MLEHATFLLRQRAAFDSEVKSVLDSWVRYEAQEREGKQRDLVKSVIANVRDQLGQADVQKQILDQAITDISGACRHAVWPERNAPADIEARSSRLAQRGLNGPERKAPYGSAGLYLPVHP
jgi:multimeric flavodoxin WrbA